MEVGANKLPQAGINLICVCAKGIVYVRGVPAGGLKALRAHRGGPLQCLKAGCMHHKAFARLREEHCMYAGQAPRPLTGSFSGLSGLALMILALGNGISSPKTMPSKPMPACRVYHQNWAQALAW